MDHPDDAGLRSAAPTPTRLDGHRFSARSGRPGYHETGCPGRRLLRTPVRILKILAVVVVGVAALLGVALFVLARYLESEAFRRAAVGAAQETLGASVTVGEMHVSLFSGATFRQVVVGNPPGLTGELLRADALIVRPGSSPSSAAGSRSRSCVSMGPPSR